MNTDKKAFKEGRVPRDVYSLDPRLSTAFTAPASDVLKLKAICKDIEMHKRLAMTTLPSTVLPREGTRMNGLKMMWLELNGQLVCRWADDSETTESVLRRLTDDLDGSSGATGADQPSLAVGKAA